MVANRVKKYTRIATLYVLGVLFVYIAFANTLPFSTTRHYYLGTKEMTDIGPSGRVKYEGENTRINNSLVYYSTRSNIRFEAATVHTEYQNNTADKEVWLGYKDADNWSYNKTLLDSPLVNSMTWPRIGNGPYLYQRSSVYSSIESLMSSPPRGKAIGYYDYDVTKTVNKPLYINNYSPRNSITNFSTPIRGKYTMYAYLDKEKFSMSFVKRDLNWYQGPDETKITVSIEGETVIDGTISDDGNLTNNKRLGNTQSITLNNPGPELPTSGVYKIEIEQPADVVTTGIATNLHKVVFANPVWFVNNKDIYKGVAAKTVPSVVYSYSDLRVSTFHTEAFQDVTTDREQVSIQTLDSKTLLKGSTENLQTYNFPKSDVYLNSSGFISLAKDSYFEPYTFNFKKISNTSDLENIDYLLTSYSAPTKLSNGWMSKDLDFDLSNSRPKDGVLSWIIQTPGIEVDGTGVTIKSMDTVLYKKGWIH